MGTIDGTEVTANEILKDQFHENPASVYAHFSGIIPKISLFGWGND